jgi:serine/threonine protein kinase
MKCCGRGTLRDWFLKEEAARSLTMYAILRVVSQIVSLLGFLVYDVQLSHSDVKWDNLLFDDDGFLRLADFGTMCTFSGRVGYDKVGGGDCGDAPRKWNPRYAHHHPVARTTGVSPIADFHGFMLVIVRVLYGRYACVCMYNFLHIAHSHCLTTLVIAARQPSLQN